MNSFLIIDDSISFCQALQDNFIQRGFEVKIAHNNNDALKIANNFNPEVIILDLKIKNDSGLELIPKLLEIDPKTRIIILTGYADISTAVESIKLGAIHYLSKPVSTDEIINACYKDEGDPNIPVEYESLKFNLAQKKHILEAFARNEYNISATARELGMHRRTLQRKLDKFNV